MSSSPDSNEHSAEKKRSASDVGEDASEPTTLTPSDSVVSSAAEDPNATRTLVVESLQGASGLRMTEDFFVAGTMLDEFELKSFIGSGGMGRVFLALDSNLGRTVALKVLYPEKMTNTEVVQRFRTEAQSMAALNHPNVVQVYTFRDMSDTNPLCLAMEYVPGVNVRDRVNEEGPLSVPLTVGYALQIAHALAHLEERRIVHRDIKPSNILITDDEVAKLLDFGLARQFDPNTVWEPDETPSPNDITASGVTLGTFDYISPEQARDPRAVDCRSDIYSLGCTLYFMLTGNPPFPQGNPLQKLLQHQSDTPLDIRLHRSDVPESLCQILIRAMKKLPTERYAHPQEMIQDLEQVAAELNLPPKYGFGLIHHAASETEEVHPSFRWKTLRRHLFWIVPLGVLCAALIGLSWLWAPGDEVHIPNEDLPPAIPAASPNDGACCGQTLTPTHIFHDWTSLPIG